MAEITLLRHGRPTVELNGRLHAYQLGDIVKRYNQSGIRDTPSPEVIQAISQNRLIVCSHLPRSVESAYALGFEDIHVSDTVFREVDLPYFDRGRLSLSVDTWSSLLRILSLFGFSRNGESYRMAIKRARVATTTLVDLAQRHSRVLLVGHGFMNYFIARELLSRNWTGPSKSGRNYWEYSTYRTE